MCSASTNCSWICCRGIVPPNARGDSGPAHNKDGPVTPPPTHTTHHRKRRGCAHRGCYNARLRSPRAPQPLRNKEPLSHEPPNHVLHRRRLGRVVHRRTLGRRQSGHGGSDRPSRLGWRRGRRSRRGRRGGGVRFLFAHQPRRARRAPEPHRGRVQAPHPGRGGHHQRGDGRAAQPRQRGASAGRPRPLPVHAARAARLPVRGGRGPFARHPRAGGRLRPHHAVELARQSDRLQGGPGLGGGLHDGAETLGSGAVQRHPLRRSAG